MSIISKTWRARHLVQISHKRTTHELYYYISLSKLLLVRIPKVWFCKRMKAWPEINSRMSAIFSLCRPVVAAWHAGVLLSLFNKWHGTQKGQEWYPSLFSLFLATDFEFHLIDDSCNFFEANASSYLTTFSSTCPIVCFMIPLMLFRFTSRFGIKPEGSMYLSLVCSCTKPLGKAHDW